MQLQPQGVYNLCQKLMPLLLLPLKIDDLRERAKEHGKLYDLFSVGSTSILHTCYSQSALTHSFAQPHCISPDPYTL